MSWFKDLIAKAQSFATGRSEPAPAKKSYLSTPQMSPATKGSGGRYTNALARRNQGSAENVRRTRVDPTSYGTNLFSQARGLRGDEQARTQGYLPNPNVGPLLPGHLSHHYPRLQYYITADDWLAHADEKLKTKQSYQGQKVNELTNKAFGRLDRDQQLGAQHNSLLDELAKIDLDMYGALDAGDKDGRVTWGEAKDRSQQKGDKKAFREVYGRDPSKDDTYAPNLTSYLNTLGIKDLDLYTAKDAQDMVNDLYLTDYEIGEGRGGTGPRSQLATSLFEGVQDFDRALSESKGVPVTEQGVTDYSKLDFSQFTPDQRTNLAMTLAQGLKDTDPVVLLGLESALEDVELPEGARQWYATGGEPALDMSYLADPDVAEGLKDFSRAITSLVEDEAAAGGLAPDDIHKLLSGEDHEFVSSKDYLDSITGFLQSQGFRLTGQQLAEWVQRKNEAEDMSRSTSSSTGKKYKSTGGSEELRALLYGEPPQFNLAHMNQNPDYGSKAAGVEQTAIPSTWTSADVPELVQQMLQANASNEEILKKLGPEAAPHLAAMRR